MSFDNYINIILVTCLFFLILTFMLIIQYQNRKKHRDTPFFNLAFISGIIALCFYFFGEFFQQFEIKSQLIALEFITFFFFFIYRHFLAIIPSDNKVNLFNFFIFGSLVFSSTLIFFLYTDFIQVNQDPRTIAQISSFFVAILSFSFSLYVAKNVYIQVNDNSTRNDMLAIISFFIGAWIWFLNGVYAIIFKPNQLEYNIGFVDIVANLLYFVGGIILTLNYLKHKNYIYRIPIPIYKILLIRKSGLLIYSKTFKNIRRTSKTEEMSDLTLAGFLSTIPSLFKALFGEQSHVSNIKAGKFDFYFCRLSNHDSINLIFITSGMSTYLERSIANLSNDFSAEFIKELANEDNINHLEGLIDILIQSHFPFLNLSSNINL